MRRSISAIILAACVALPGAAFADTYWYCQFVPQSSPRLYYFSDVFGPLEDEGIGKNNTLTKMLAAITTYVDGKYSEKNGFPGCAHYDSKDKAKAELKRNEELITKQGKFIATGWRYTGT